MAQMGRAPVGKAESHPGDRVGAEEGAGRLESRVKQGVGSRTEEELARD